MVAMALTACKQDPDVPPVPVITITTQPTAPAALTEGSITGSLTVTATATEGAVLSYQWYSNTSATSTGGTAISSATGANYTLPTDLAPGTYHYFCEVSAERATSVRTGAVTVTVNARPVPEITIATQPTPPTGLVEGSIPAGSGITVAATVTLGATLSYQWYTYDPDTDDIFEAIDGATAASYTLPTNLVAGEYWYVCEVSAPEAESKRTDPVTVTVAAPAGTSTETTAEYDNSNFGLYKGVIAGSSGTIRIEINNGNNIARATIVIDGVTDQLTSTASFTAGQAISGAVFSGNFSSFTFSVDADGGNPKVETITVQGHSNVIATVAKEKSDDVSLCYEGTSTGGQNHSGVFNVVRNKNTFSGVAKAVDGFTCYISGNISANGSFTGNSTTTFNGLVVSVTYSGRFVGDQVSGTWNNSWNGGSGANSGSFTGSQSSGGQ